MNISYTPFNCQFLVAENIGNGFVFTELYQFTETSKRFSLQLGSWNGKSGLNFTEDSLFQRRSDFQKEEVKIVPYVPVSFTEFSENFKRPALLRFFFWLFFF